MFIQCLYGNGVHRDLLLLAGRLDDDAGDEQALALVLTAARTVVMIILASLCTASVVALRSHRLCRLMIRISAPDFRPSSQAVHFIVFSAAFSQS